MTTRSTATTAKTNADKEITRFFLPDIYRDYILKEMKLMTAKEQKRWSHVLESYAYTVEEIPKLMVWLEKCKCDMMEKYKCDIEDEYFAELRARHEEEMIEYG